MVCFEIVEILVLRYQTTGALIWQLFGIALGLVIMVLAAILRARDHKQPASA
jgi:tetrahydromethanopterin S-methyltransferase subunit B